METHVIASLLSMPLCPRVPNPPLARIISDRPLRWYFKTDASPQSLPTVSLFLGNHTRKPHGLRTIHPGQSEQRRKSRRQ